MTGLARTGSTPAPGVAAEEDGAPVAGVSPGLALVSCIKRSTLDHRRGARREPSAAKHAMNVDRDTLHTYKRPSLYASKKCAHHVCLMLPPPLPTPRSTQNQSTHQHQWVTRCRSRSLPLGD